MGWGIAMCPNCRDEPLVSTFFFPKKEFICLKCGKLWEFLQPVSAEETPELLELMEARKNEWADNARSLLNDHSWHAGCEKCNMGSSEYHISHATDEEKKADAIARQWLEQRVGVAV